MGWGRGRMGGGGGRGLVLNGESSVDICAPFCENLPIRAETTIEI